jgi:hypothetical protein
MRERDSREEDKEEGRGLGRGLIFFVLGKLWKRGKRRRKIGRIVCFGELS